MDPRGATAELDFDFDFDIALTPCYSVFLDVKALLSSALSISVALVACSSSSVTNGVVTDAGAVDLGGDGSPAYVDGGLTPVQHPTDGGFATADGGVIRADRFVMKVESVTYGPCAGFGQAQLPGIVQGPPLGGGDLHGSLDVLSLGTGGQIVLSFGDNAIVDAPGPDFIVFENPFYVGGMQSDVFAEPGEVSVSEDGTTWKTYPCTATAAPYGACAGWHPVYSTPDNGLSPFDPKVAGGDAFDLADVGLTEARFVRIVDKTNEACAMGSSVDTNGFDLDAISIVHAKTP